MLNAYQEKVHEQLRVLKETHEDQFLGKNGITGMSVAFKTVKGRVTDDLAICFYVRKKGPVLPEFAIPARLADAPTDVVEADFQPDVGPPPLPNPDTSRYFSLVGGMSICPSRIFPGFGTLGIMVTDMFTGNPMMLSNHHVLVGGDSNPNVGDVICQPAATDAFMHTCGNCATLSRWFLGPYNYLQPDGNGIIGTQFGIDAAVAIKSTNLRHSEVGVVKDYGSVRCTPAWAYFGMQVVKRGRSSLYTQGTVISTTLTSANLEYGEWGLRTMRNLIMVASVPGGPPSFTLQGDSGSVYIAPNGSELIGLHFLSGGGYSAGTPIGPVFERLSVRIP